MNYSGCKFLVPEKHLGEGIFCCSKIIHVKNIKCQVTQKENNVQLKIIDVDTHKTIFFCREKFAKNKDQTKSDLFKLSVITEIPDHVIMQTLNKINNDYDMYNSFISLITCESIINRFLNNDQYASQSFCSSREQYSSEYFACTLSFDKRENNYKITCISDDGDTGPWTYHNNVSIIIDKQNKQKICDMLSDRKQKIKDILKFQSHKHH